MQEVNGVVDSSDPVISWKKMWRKSGLREQLTSFRPFFLLFKSLSIMMRRHSRLHHQVNWNKVRSGDSVPEDGTSRA